MWGWGVGYTTYIYQSEEQINIHIFSEQIVSTVLNFVDINCENRRLTFTAAK